MQSKTSGKSLERKKFDVLSYQNETFLKSILDGKMLDSLEGVYRDAYGSPVYLKKAYNTLSVSPIDHKYNDFSIREIYEYYDLIDYTQNPAIKKWNIVSNLNRKHSFINSQSVHSVHDTLLVYTTCNHINMTMHSLESLSSAPDSFDILVIDDHSVDGTVPILNKKGYSVISKLIARGLTDSWNIGYHVATLLKYRYVIFSNNDVLVPHGAIDIVRSSLQHEALVVPLTTRKGAGHNPSQSIEAHYDIDSSHLPIINNPSNFQLIQNILSEMHNISGTSIS